MTHTIYEQNETHTIVDNDTWENITAQNAEMLEALQLANSDNMALVAINTELLEALEFALTTYNDMTTTQFSHGEDKQARERMAEAIRKAKGE